jgi:hypothetical protein
MSTIDYTTVKPEDLEIVREPRKSKIRLRHIPSGTLAETPLSPGTLKEVRFRRHNSLPKENRQKDMTGYIETTSDDTAGFWPIIGEPGQENFRNDYLIAVAADANALKASFEGADKAGPATDEPKAPAPPKAAADPTVAPDGTAQPAAPTEPPVEVATTTPDVKEELDELLAGLG